MEAVKDFAIDALVGFAFAAAMTLGFAILAWGIGVWAMIAFDPSVMSVHGAAKELVIASGVFCSVIVLLLFFAGLGVLVRERLK